MREKVLFWLSPFGEVPIPGRPGQSSRIQVTCPSHGGSGDRASVRAQIGLPPKAEFLLGSCAPWSSAFLLTTSPSGFLAIGKMFRDSQGSYTRKISFFLFIAGLYVYSVQYLTFHSSIQIWLHNSATGPKEPAPQPRTSLSPQRTAL